MFDLDGTLLPMDQDAFTEGYFKYLIKKAAPRGYDPKTLISAIWHGTGAMVRNDGTRSNEDAFWEDFTSFFGEQALEDKPLFEEFYAVEFQQAQQLCGYDPLAAEAVKTVREAGARAILETNPIFPAVATQSRIRWAGLSPDDFELYTTYENIGVSKPNPAYYTEILRRTGLAAQECIMVGNDVEEDMIARTLGFEVFLLTDCLINRGGSDIDQYPHGGFEELIGFLKEAL